MHQTNAIERSSYVARSASETNKRDWKRAQRGWHTEADADVRSILSTHDSILLGSAAALLGSGAIREDHSIIRQESRRLAVFCGICEAV